MNFGIESEVMLAFGFFYTPTVGMTSFPVLEVSELFQNADVSFKLYCAIQYCHMVLLVHSERRRCWFTCMHRTGWFTGLGEPANNIDTIGVWTDYSAFGLDIT